MNTKILLTSFTKWLPHQKSNSSDDLLAKLQKQNCPYNTSLFFLRSLPVDTQLASQQTIAEINRIQPDVVICCGMAEKRKKLAIESRAWCNDTYIYTAVDLQKLHQKLMFTKISDDAGKFVCESLYYQILKYSKSQANRIDCIFLHVPKLESSNSDLIFKDFLLILSWFKAKTLHEQR